MTANELRVFLENYRSLARSEAVGTGAIFSLLCVLMQHEIDMLEQPVAASAVETYQYKALLFKSGDLDANVARLNTEGVNGWKVVAMVGDDTGRQTICYLIKTTPGAP